MQIEEGIFYKRRDGRKEGPAKPHKPDKSIYPMCSWEVGGLCYQDNGTLGDGDEPHEYDLIAEWEDEPTKPITIETVKRINPGSGMDAGEFVNQPIEITPTANGGYVVRRQPAAFEMSAISTWLAFSDYTDLLNWLTDEYPAANTAGALEGK